MSGIWLQSTRVVQPQEFVGPSDKAALLLAWLASMPFNDAGGYSNGAGYIAGDATQITFPLTPRGSGRTAAFSGATATAGLMLPKSITLSSARAWSIAFGCTYTGTTTHGMLLGQYNTANSWLRLDSGGSRFVFTNAAGASSVLSTGAIDTAFHDWLLVANGTGTIYLLKDGLPIASAAATASFVLDSFGYAYNSSSYLYSGTLDYCYVIDGDARPLAPQIASNPYSILADELTYIPISSALYPTLTAAALTVTSSGVYPACNYSGKP